MSVIIRNVLNVVNVGAILMIALRSLVNFVAMFPKVGKRMGNIVIIAM